MGAGKWIIGATVTGVGFVLAIAGSPGPPWPTGPSIKASNLDRLPPLSVPFDVQNKSILFKTHVRSIACMLPSYFVTKSGSAEIAEAAVLVPLDVNLPRDSTIPFKCPLDISIYKTTPFKLYFCIQYDAPFYEFWKSREVKESGTFYWDNDHWTEGLDLKQSAANAYESVAHDCELPFLPRTERTKVLMQKYGIKPSP